MEQGGIIYRRLIKGEEDFLREMLFEAIYLPEEEKQKLSKDIILHPDLKKYYENWGKKGDIAIVAELHNELIGCGWSRLFSFRNKGYGYIDDKIPEISVAVSPGYRNRGIGTRLIRELIRESNNKGFPCLSLSVSKNNPSVHLYLRENFIVFRENQHDFIMIFDPQNTVAK